MRTEQDIMEQIISVANTDDRIRAVSMEGSRANPAVPKDQYQDYDITYYVTDITFYYNQPEWVVERFGKPLIMQMPEAMRWSDGGGHSWGANLALVYSMTYPKRVKALLYIAGPGVHENRHWLEEFHRNVDEIGERLPEMEYPFNMEVNDEGNRSLREFGRRPDFYSRISKLAMPALFILAENDIRPNWPAEQLANLIPNAKTEVIKGASHYIWLDKAEELGVVLSDFFLIIKELY